MRSRFTRSGCCGRESQRAEQQSAVVYTLAHVPTLLEEASTLLFPFDNPSTSETRTRYIAVRRYSSKERKARTNEIKNYRKNESTVIYYDASSILSVNLLIVPDRETHVREGPSDFFLNVSPWTSMIEAGSDHFLAVPVEATAFLGAVAGFVVLLLAIFLYLSRKWCFTPPTSAALFGGVCVPLCESSNSSGSQISKNIGKAFSYSDPETSSDSEEDALRRLNSHPHPPPDTLTIQAEDGPAIVDAGTTSSSCTEEHSPSVQQQQCVVEVGASGIILDGREDEPEIEENAVPTTNDVIATMGAAQEEIGSLEVAFLYDAPMREMTVQVLQGRNYPTGIGGSQVRLVLLPSKKQRRKTRVRQGTSPQYMESFLLPRVNPEDVNAMGVRLRVYFWGGRMRRERLLGEARVSFDQINLQLETTLWLTLQPPPSSVQDWGTSSSLTRSDSTGSQQSVQSYALPTIPPYGSSMKGGSVAEILIGLSYNGTTGRLSVEIIKGSHFRGGGGNDTKPPDTYVKLALVDSNGHEMDRSKTYLKRAQPNPLYKQTFVFQVALFQLGDVTLFVSVYNRRNRGMGKKGREMIGWLCLGLNSSGPEELQHWNDMRTARQPTQVQRWHSLLRP